MRVAVYKAGAGDMSLGVDGMPGAGVGEVADSDDTAFFDADIAFKGGLAAAI